MRIKLQSAPAKVLLGAACVGALVLAALLALAVADDEDPRPSGVAGIVIAWPCNPVETASDPPCPGYVGEIRILRPDGSVVTTSRTDRDGRFRINLPPGRYVVDPEDGGKSLANGDGRVTVREGRYARVELTHYTGLL
jgi:hypothetical protein